VNITGIAALDVLIGLFFLFFLLSIVCSAVNEGIATTLNLRAKTLERGIRNMLVSDEAVKAFYEHWRVQVLFMHRRLLPGNRHPSYIPARIFALTVLDTFAPPAGRVPSHDLLARAKSALGGAPSGTARGLLQDALDDAGGNIQRLQLALERSFNEVMERASGWYKRRVQLILLAVALVLVGAINADSFALAQRLWKDDALRSSVVAQAIHTVNQNRAICAKQAGDKTPADVAARCIDQVKQLGIPLGWSGDTSPHSFFDGLGKVLGLLVTAFALTLGAPFWFDLLGKVAQLRGSGPPPPTR
jgi:hypothetical protein